MAKNTVVLKVNGDLTINEGVTLTACKNANGYGGPKGLLIYCTGTITNNGTISMTKRGAYAQGQDVWLWKNTDGSYEYVPAEGAPGTEKCKSSWGTVGNFETGRQTGSGGAGNAYFGYLGSAGAGAAGTSYSGGSGGGGYHNRDHSTTSAYSADDGSSNGGIGGAGRGISGGGDLGGNWHAGGGAGNPGNVGCDHNSKAEDGTGGLLIIYADTIENNSKIEANGSAGGFGSRGNGGSSGAGSINIFYKNLIQNGEISSEGGTLSGGGSGGSGTCVAGDVETGKFVKDEENSTETLTQITDLYGIIQQNNGTFNDYGITYTRSGRNDYTEYDTFYKLGQGSWSGVNTNTFTLTIDYETLINKLNIEGFNGIYTKLHHQGETTDWSDTSWMWSEMIVNYTDGTNTTKRTSTESWNHRSGSVEPELTINFDDNKSVNSIKIIIHGFDADDGYVIGYVKNMNLLP